MKGEGIQSKLRRWFSNAYAIAFVLLLGMPLLFLPFTGESDRASEKRVPVAFPSLSSDYGGFSRAFEEWFEDHFGFRSAMIRFYRQSRFELGLLNSLNNVVRGKDNWLYYSGDGRGDTIQAYTGANAFSESELNRLQLYFETWGNWLEDQGIEFLVLVAPNKVSVYPEYLPNRISRSPFGTRIERFLERMSGSGVSVVFPLDELLEEKSEYSPVYYKLDTHWNGKGALVAYEAVAKALPVIRRFPSSDFRLEEGTRNGGDLSRMLGIESEWKDLGYRIALNNGSWAKGEGEWMNTRNTIYRFSMDDPALPRALIVHDSFMEPLGELLARHFRETTFSFESSLRRDLILEIQPDFVLLEFTERFLHSYLNGLLPVGGDGH